jgi:hypothetical protein
MDNLQFYKNMYNNNKIIRTNKFANFINMKKVRIGNKYLLHYSCSLLYKH